MYCKRCNNKCIKNGFQANSTQRYYCKLCVLSQQKYYIYTAYLSNTNIGIYKLLINSCGISDISRVLNIAKNTVSSRILKIAHNIKRPLYYKYNQSYEVDEIYVKSANKKRYYIIYAINKITKEVVSFFVGRRTDINIAKVINCLLLLNPKKIYTDSLAAYSRLIPKSLHIQKRYLTNNIERYNLNIRTHIKRMSRKTICYSKSVKITAAIMRIYFWGNSTIITNT